MCRLINLPTSSWSITGNILPCSALFWGWHYESRHLQACHLYFALFSLRETLSSDTILVFRGYSSVLIMVLSVYMVTTARLFEKLLDFDNQKLLGNKEDKTLCLRSMAISLQRRSNIDLAGCGTGHKIVAGCGIREIARAAYGMKTSWRDRDALIQLVGCEIVLKSIAGWEI